MSIVAFFDNDIVLKLSEYNLIHEACATLRLSPMQIGVVPSSVNVFRDMHSKTSKGKLNKYSLVGIDRAISFVESTQPTVNYPNLDWSLDLDNIDIGEAQLATWAAESTTASLLLTGDKRFMKAIAIHQEANDIFSQLTGRVVCFEELVKHLIKHIGIDIVRKCVTNSPNCDGALSLVFGNRFDLPESQVIDGLDSMIQDIIKEVGATWLKCLS